MNNKTEEYLAITVDVECDADGGATWQYSNPLTFTGVTDAVAHKLQPLFNRYGAKPTYLIGNVVLEDPTSVETLATLTGDYELGTHLHGDFIGPHETSISPAGAKTVDNQCQYADAIELAKMQSITELFERRFQQRPVSFRAGRFSAGARTIRILEELGYEVDTSVTPHLKWIDSGRNLDFRSAPEQPYYPAPTNILQPGTARVLEVPVTITPRLYAGIFAFIDRLVKLPGAGNSRFYSTHVYRWLRPTYFDGPAMIDIMKSYRANYQSTGRVIYTMMFHNIEAQPDVNPCNKTPVQCHLFLNRIETVLKYCVDNEIKMVSLSDIAKAYERQ